MIRRRIRLKPCARCGQRTRPAEEDGGRCSGCFAPYFTVLRGTGQPAYTRPRVLRSDDDSPDEAA